MTTGYTVNGTDLASIFGAKGTHTAAATGYKTNGTDLNAQLLALADGVAIGYATGYKVNGADLNTIFGAPPTSLPINGGTYDAQLTRDGTSGAQCRITFSANTSTWVLAPSGAAGTLSPGGNFASGSIPSGATSMSCSWSNVTGLYTPINLPQTALSSNPSSFFQCTSAGTIGTASGSATLTIVFYNSGGTAISTTTCNLGVAIVN